MIQVILWVILWTYVIYCYVKHDDAFDHIEEDKDKNLKE